MQFIFAKRQKTASFAAGTAAASLLACGILMSVSTSTLADTHNFDAENHKTSLVSLYREWKASREKQVVIQPTAAKAAKKAAKSVKHAAKKPAGENITDAEILAQSAAEANDPFEPLNRLIFGFNEVLDMVVLTPISYTYRAIVPDPIRAGVSGVIANVKAPVTFVNDLLQGKPERAKTTLMRFLINTTAGMGGFVDAAEAAGFEKHTEDFGQTLAVWGVGPGPYLVVPVFGPATPRHIVGRVADTAAAPTTWILADFGLLERSAPTIADLVTGHEAILDDVKTLRETSPDFYASVRDIYRQTRSTAVLDGNLEVDPIPDLPIE